MITNGKIEIVVMVIISVFAVYGAALLSRWADDRVKTKLKEAEARDSSCFVLQGVRYEIFELEGRRYLSNSKGHVVRIEDEITELP